ncbi:hypothetical protein D9757_000892 [Collybiopsis confluens]|uniref:Glutamyl-tRNA(Gln) amidotransferase subunit A, mitochondrial n=1 Tax=Collybiopsis confluens TaxID=2823264 RepID=A0A8H5MFQ2_9AGAR|nr:hypothetical protein D9757_000892 [Collybiopsis confluens]
MLLRRFASNVSALRAKDVSINAFVAFNDSESVSSNGPLNGCTIAVKDNICTSHLPTTASSAILKDFHSPFDATVVQILTKNGAEIIGKTNCDEFGMGSLNIHSVHGPVVNPFNVEERRAAGGSSGGSAAAVAAGLCHAALGTDTGGSIRLPASYCGVVGLKPSYGLVSRHGIISYADSLDTVGVLAKDVSTVENVFGHINKHDYRDPTSIDERVRERARNLSLEQYESNRHSNTQDLKGLRIGVPQEYFPSELSSNPIISSIRNILSLLRSRGATVLPVSLPSTKYALSAYYVIASAEGSSCLSRYDGIEYGLRVKPPGEENNIDTSAKIYAHTRSHGFGREVRKRILLGTYALSADAFDNYFLQAQRVRQMVRDDFDSVFFVSNILASSSTTPKSRKTDGVDVLIHPSAIRTAPRLPIADDAGEPESASRDTLQDYVQDVLTVPASLAGLPALSVPVPQAVRNQNVEKGDGWPIGVSVVGQWGSDELVLKVGRIIEEMERNGL